MSKKSLIQKEIKKEHIVKKFLKKRIIILKQFKNLNSNNNIFLFYNKIQKLPRNSNKIRLTNRCWKTGKARSVYNFFGLCRNTIRELAYDCVLPGLIKSSW